MNVHAEVARAQADDAARELAAMAVRMEQLAGAFDPISKTSLIRISDKVRTIARLKHPRHVATTTPMHGDVSFD